MSKVVKYFTDLLKTLRQIERHLSDISDTTRQGRYGRYMNTDRYN